MQNDVNGCSTCPAGQERFNIYWSPLAQDMRTQYDYRTPEGKLFSCIANSLEDAHAKRDAWLQEEEQARERWILATVGPEDEVVRDEQGRIACVTRPIF